MDELLIKYISIIDRHNKIYLDKKLKEIGLNSSHHFYIINIYKNPGISQDKLINMTHLNPSNITRALCTLERLGFIKKISNEDDRRTYNLYLTDKGIDIYPKIIKIVDELKNILLGDFSEKEKSNISKLIEKICINSLKSTKY